ncbi:MAG: NfeD family protein [Gammaproteobacteria bacterium]|nr:MAG: NfeD family protein [Gammaproteobacteria bacterium]
MEFLQHATHWHWWVLAVFLIILEVFSPAAFFLWMGVAAGVTGFAVLAQPELGWEYQLLIFALFSVVSIVSWRRYLVRHPIQTDQPSLNRRGEQYVDRLFTLEEPIVNGQGRIKVDDSTWKISGTDCAQGAKVRVVGVDGVILLVETLE